MFKPFSPKVLNREQRGVSLAELAVTVIVASIILSVSLGLIVTQRRQYVNQQANTNTNQNLQAAMDMVGNDIRQVGERISSGNNLPVIQIIDGATGSPDTLVLQRKLFDTPLSVCQTVSGAISTIRVNYNPVPPNTRIPGCPFSDGDSPADGLSDDAEQWKEYRCKLDGVDGCQNPVGNCKQTGGTNTECSWAYIYDPINGRGEFFLYSDEGPDPSDSQFYQIRLPSANAFTYTYNPDPNNPPQLYILEQRTYRLSNPDSKGDRTLNLQLRDSKDNVNYDIVNRLRNFQVKGLIQKNPDVFVDQFNNIFTPPKYTDWQTLLAVQLSLEGSNSAPDSPPTRNFTSQFYPRNSLSRP